MHPYLWAQLIKFLLREWEKRVPKSLGGIQESEKDYSVCTYNAIIALFKWRDLLISKILGEDIMIGNADIEKLRKLIQKFDAELNRGIEELREMAPPPGWGRFRRYLLKVFDCWKCCVENLNSYLYGLEDGWEKERINNNKNSAVSACNLADEWLSKAINDKSDFFNQSQY